MYLDYVLHYISGGGRQDDASPQTSQHFRAIKVHDPIEVRVVLFREFGFCPLGGKIGQYLRLNGSPWFICYVEQEELDSPFSNPARGITVISYVVEWYFRGHRN